MHVFLRKSPLCRSHFFEWLKTAISSNACGTSTLKSPPSRAFFVSDVHLRPRKHFSRCTLDCGFKTPESPALRGFEAERCPITGTSLYLVIFSNGDITPQNTFKTGINALKSDGTCNDDGNAPIYIEHDGRLFILDCAYGDQYYNSNIPDEFTLTAQTDDRIDFTVTAHYSYPYPRWDETYDERDERLETSYEYTRIYPVTLIYTDAGWRFDAFTTPNQADMQLLGEWDGVEETDFYLPNN